MSSVTDTYRCSESLADFLDSVLDDLLEPFGFLVCFHNGIGSGVWIVCRLLLYDLSHREFLIPTELLAAFRSSRPGFPVCSIKVQMTVKEHI